MTATAHTAQRILIVGGGVSGLSIGARLVEAGLPVTILEAARLGYGASMRNQGWLHSGAWFARTDESLARMCYESLQGTLRFCPECVEPETKSMAYLISKPETLRNAYLEAWEGAGIPYEEWPLEELFAELPGLDGAQVQQAYRLPDRVIRPQILLTHLAAAAENAGAEIRVETCVTGLLENDGAVCGVVTGTGEELKGRLVILAGNAEGAALWPMPPEDAIDGQPGYRRVALKAHLAAVQPAVGRVPLCVLDAEGFNHLPHAPSSVFGSGRWPPVSLPNDQEIVDEEAALLWNLIERFFPGLDRANATQWAGTTVQAMHLEQVAPGEAPLPTIIDHGRDSPRVENLLSVFPGRATLWPQLAEDCRKLVLEMVGSRPKRIERPMWLPE